MKKISGAIIWFFLLSLIISLGAFPPGARASPQGQIGPLNPAFEQKTQELKALTWQKGGGQSNFGYFPSPLDWSHLRGKRILSSTQSSFPSSYDLRALGKVPAVRDQGSYSTCWAFAALGSLESVLLPSESWNFSEDNLLNTSGFDPDPYTGGGNYDMATAYLARWSGPVREDQDPYPTPGFITFPPSKHVQEVLYLTPRSGPLDNDTIKSALMSYGGVYTSIYWQDSYYNPQKYSYFYSGSQIPNHAVVIVGWNDDYPASNFSNTPSGKGAFIVRNSWGSSWGEGGYFYVSYYDTRIGGELAVFNNAEPTDNYTNIYQYDPLGWTASYGFGSNTAWFANVFQATKAENIKALSFYTASLNSTYEIYFGASLSELYYVSGGIIPIPGYHTIALSSPLPVSAGQLFVVAVKLTTPGYLYPVPLEYPLSEYSSKASSSLGQSYVSPDGIYWEDIASLYPNSNVCLKAFASPGDSFPKLTITPTYLDFGKDNSKLSLIVSNEGTSTLSWEARKNIDWVVDLSPSSGSLSPSTNTTVSVTVSREGLPPGNYQGLILFASDGGNEEIVVSLTIDSQPSGFPLPLKEGWNMISLPYASMSDPNEVFANISGSWSLWEWDPLSLSYIGKSQISLRTGAGYWLKSSKTQTVYIVGAPFPEKELSISLQMGWNLIGFPFDTPLGWDQVLIRYSGSEFSLDQAASLKIISSNFYWWQGDSYLNVKTGIGAFEPGKGYWVKALKECQLVFRLPNDQPPSP